MLWKKLRQQTEVHQVDKKSITGPLRHWSATNIKGKTNKLLTTALTSFPTADADEKNTPKNTNWPVAFRSFAKKHRSSFTTRSRRRKRSPRGQAPLSPLLPFNLAAMSSRPAALSSLTLKLFRGTDLSLRCSSSSRGCCFCCCCWVDRTQNQVEISSAPPSH